MPAVPKVWLLTAQEQSTCKIELRANWQRSPWWYCRFENCQNSANACQIKRLPFSIISKCVLTGFVFFKFVCFFWCLRQPRLFIYSLKKKKRQYWRLMLKYSANTISDVTPYINAPKPPTENYLLWPKKLDVVSALPSSFTWCLPLHYSPDTRAFICTYYTPSSMPSFLDALCDLIFITALGKRGYYCYFLNTLKPRSYVT